jgi:predicted DNA-binding transcriptional regulator AlpA
VRISAFLTPCDSQIYKRRKEEEIDCYVSLENLSHILNISKSTLHKLCQNEEIPYHKISAKYFFKASEINNWLKHHFGSKKKMKKDQKQKVRIFDIEPLISVKEAAEIFDTSRTFIYRLGIEVPYYRIGGSIRYRLSDLENYRDKKRVDLWEISTRIGGWKSSYVWPEPSTEELMVRKESYKRQYNENARPGYIVKENTFRSPNFEDLKQTIGNYIKDNIQARSNILVCNYYIISRLKLYGCELKWWGLPEGREDYRIHSTGLSSDSPDKLRDKVDRLLKKVPKEDLIDVDYYSWFLTWDDKPHHARVTYYLPKEK